MQEQGVSRIVAVDMEAALGLSTVTMAKREPPYAHSKHRDTAMSTLQISLAILGIVFLGLVLAYNAWAYRRAAPRKARPQGQAALAPTPHCGMSQHLGGVDITQASTHPAGPAPVGAEPDATPAAGQAFIWADVEPGPGGPFALADAAPLPGASGQCRWALGGPCGGCAHRPQPGGPSATPAGAGGCLLPPARSWMPCSMPLPNCPSKQPLAGEAILKAQPTTRRAGSKLFRVEGLELLSGQVGNRACRSALHQLASRGAVGQPAGRAQRDRVFRVRGQSTKLWRCLNAGVDLPDMLHEVVRARELDQFAGEHDAQLSFMLRPTRAAWSPGAIAQHAGALGFVPAADARAHGAACRPNRACAPA